MYTIAAAALLAGSALAAPSGINARDDQSCAKKTANAKSWAVTDFDFHASYIFTTPAHQNSWGYVNFTLENPVYGYKSQCSGSSNQLSDFFYGSMVYTCKGPEDGPYAGNEATFTFNRPVNEVKINETWGCAEPAPWGSRYTAYGGAVLDLKCNEENWQNPDWKQGQIYSSRTITCDHIDASVPITSMSGVA